MEECIRRYFEWNNAIRSFFLDDSDLPAKLLCITDDLLNEIGDHYNIEKPEDESYSECFRNSVILTTTGRQKLIDFWYDAMGARALRERRPNGNLSLFNLAFHLTQARLRDDIDYFRLPFLALAALFVYLCAEDRAPKAAVIRSISNHSGADETFEGDGFDHIPEIFSAIHNYDNSFDENVRGLRNNVGRLQYQKVLTQKGKTLFDRFLYYNNVNYDPSLCSYEDLLNYSLLRKMTGEYHDLVGLLVQGRVFRHKDFFERYLLNFERKEYQEHISNSHCPNKVNGLFFLKIDFENSRMSVFTDFKADANIVDDHSGRVLIREQYQERDGGLYPTEIRVNSLDEYYGLIVDNQFCNINVAQHPAGVLYFQWNEGNAVAMQVDHPQQSHSYYVAVKRQRNAERIITDLCKNHNCVKINSSSDFTWNEDDSGWNVFFVDCWNAEPSVRGIIRNQDARRLVGGIEVFGMPGTYYYNSLPALSIDGIDSSAVRIIDGTIGTPNAVTSFGYQKVCHNGLLYFVATRVPNIPDGGSMLVTIRIDNCPNADISFYIYVSRREKARKIVEHEFFAYDGWNRVCADITSAYLSDNELYNNNVPTPLCTGIRNNFVHKDTISEKSNSFIELLKACYFEKGLLYVRDVNTVVDYLSGRYGVNLDNTTSKPEELSLFRDRLVKLGYLNKSYDKDSRTIYQIASPRLIPVGGNTARGRQYVLYGCYDRAQISILRNLTPNHWFVFPFSDESIIHKHPYLRFVPYYLVIMLSEDNLRAVPESITIETGSLSDKILSFVKKPDLFEQDFYERDCIRDNVNYSRAIDYPIINDNHELEDGALIISEYRPANNPVRRVPIPFALMRQYCNWKHSLPICYVTRGPVNSTLSFTSDNPLPDLLKKCMIFMNMGLPENRLVFCLDGLKGSNDIVHRFTEYTIPNEYVDAVLDSLSTEAEIIDNKRRVVYYEPYSTHRYEVDYVKPSDIYSRSIIKITATFSRSRAYAFAVRSGRERQWAVYKLHNQEYHRLDFADPVEAITKILCDNCVDDQITEVVEDLENLMSGNNESKKIKLIKYA